jgi:hypothetical protein
MKATFWQQQCNSCLSIVLIIVMSKVFDLGFFLKGVNHIKDNPPNDEPCPIFPHNRTSTNNNAIKECLRHQDEPR